MLNNRDVRILILCPPRATKKTLENIRASDVRKLAFLLGGTGGRSASNPKMDLCGLVQGVTCDLTGFYKLMVVIWISLHHGVKCDGCVIPYRQCLCPRVQLHLSTRKQL